MKSEILFILIGLVVFLGFSISGLRRELLSVKEYARQMEERNSQLQRELMRLSRVNSENERFLSELEQNIKEFENKLPFSSLEKYIPKPILNDVKPIIEKLQVFKREEKTQFYLMNKCMNKDEENKKRRILNKKHIYCDIIYKNRIRLR